MHRSLLLALSSLALISASCGASSAGDGSAVVHEIKDQFRIDVLGTFDQPWAMVALPNTKEILITERSGKLKLWNNQLKRSLDVSGVPQVDSGGQGGLGDVAIAPGIRPVGNTKTVPIYLSWVEAGPSDTRGAVVGTARLILGPKPELKDLKVVWRQDPKVTGRGHFSHRIAFSPDGKSLFLASGERQKFTPAQDLTVNLGKVLRLNLDGTPAAGNPFAAKGGISAQIWSYGHRNILGLQFDRRGQLWGLEHGPAGGDELNRIEPGKNYGWPLVSDGDHYDGKPIPRNATRPDLAAPAISWNPVIAPGDFIFYSGKLWPDWKGQALIAGMGYQGLVRVQIGGARGTEQARYPLGKRIREIREASDGALLLLEDGPGGRLLRLSRK